MRTTLDDSKAKRILQTISLANSNTREDTLRSVVLNTLFEEEKPVHIDQLREDIEVLYEFVPHSSELHSIVENLVSDEKVGRQSDEIFLSVEAKKDYQTIDLKYQDDQKKRFKTFREFISTITDTSLEITEYEILWDKFLSHLYDCYFHFGELAVSIFNPYEDISEEIEQARLEDLIKTRGKEFDSSKLTSIFKLALENFNEFISGENLDFLYELSQRTLAFASLGFSPEVMRQVENIRPMDWNLYADTNYLYAILDLTIHPEVEASKSLLNALFSSLNNFNIIFSYSSITLRELKDKRPDFEKIDDDLSIAAIQSLLKERKLDSYSRKYYTELLKDRKNTIHPKTIIDLSEKTLPAKSLTISRNKKQIDDLGLEFLHQQTEAYIAFIDRKNQLRREFNAERNTSLRIYHKGYTQARHDISLMEFILSRRNVIKALHTDSFNDARYFIVTLDDLLIEYDLYCMKKDERTIPVFIKPSFLLDKLVKMSPIQTEDYQKAFLSALASRTYNTDISGTEYYIRIANYLRRIGLDNEEVIRSFISDHVFMEKYKEEIQKPEFKEDEFIESELSRKYNEQQQELENAIKDRDKAYKKSEEYSEKLNAKESEAKSTKNELGAKQERVDVLEKSVKVLSNRLEKVEKIKANDPNQMKIDFEKGEIENKNRKLEATLAKAKEFKIKTFKDSQVKRWQRRAGKRFFIALSISVLLVGGMITSAILIPQLESYKSWISIISSILFFLVNSFFAYQWRMRNHNHSNIKAYRESVEIPDEILKEFKIEL